MYEAEEKLRQLLLKQPTAEMRRIIFWYDENQSFVE